MNNFDYAAYQFRDPESVDDDGVVAIGGPFTPERVIAGYRGGIFPWGGDPVRWHSPDPRAVFFEIADPKRFGKLIRRGKFTVTFDRCFREVIQACADVHRVEGEWITPAFIDVYSELHEQGYAHSVETWQDDRLVGGLYGIQCRGLFAGESMFHLVDNASKVAFMALADQLKRIGIVLFDCQVINYHTYQLGAVQVHRRDYLRLLQQALKRESRFEEQKWPEEGAKEWLKQFYENTR